MLFPPIFMRRGNRKCILLIWSYGEVVITLACHAKVPGSIPGNSVYAVLAQSVVQLICNQQVVGSSPTGSL